MDPNNEKSQWAYSSQAQYPSHSIFYHTDQKDSFSQNSLNRTNEGNNQGPMIGLQALCSVCSHVYPDQPNPLQVTARLKYWLGGPDPLDYVSMYWNVGCKDGNIPAHWHYISFGLSDLHGDGRVHAPPPTGPLPPDHMSGFGLELSFRLIGEPGHPPTWPAAMLQRLASYIFNTGNRLCVGDHVSWHCALDESDRIVKVDSKNEAHVKSKIRHMLVAQDPQLKSVNTPLGKVQFVQIFGISNQELRAAKRSGGTAVLEAVSLDNRCGGPWFITDLNRQYSVSLPFVTNKPSELSGVAAICRWEQWDPSTKASASMPHNSHRYSSELPQNIKDQIKCVLQKGLSEISLQSENTQKDENVENIFDKNNSIGYLQTCQNNNECEMSTESIKSILTNNKCINKETSMSTDSFEMSKMAIALMDDITNLSNDKKIDDLKSSYDRKNIKVCNESRIQDSPTNLYNSMKSDKDTPKKNDNETTTLTNPLFTSEPRYICKCKEPTQKQIMNNKDISSLSVIQCNKCAVNEIWLQEATSFPGVHLIFDKEAGSLLPLALRCRILYGYHFTWESVGILQAITFVATNVNAAFVTKDKPIAANDGWLQLLITDDFAEEIANDIEMVLQCDGDNSDDEECQQNGNVCTPLVFVWPEKGLKISVFQNSK